VFHSVDALVHPAPGPVLGRGHLEHRGISQPALTGRGPDGPLGRHSDGGHEGDDDDLTVTLQGELCHGSSLLPGV